MGSFDRADNSTRCSGSRFGWSSTLSILASVERLLYFEVEIWGEHSELLVYYCCNWVGASAESGLRELRLKPVVPRRKLAPPGSILDCRKHETLATKSRKLALSFRAMLLLVVITRCDWRQH
jgi:hypothetical protein